MRSFALALLLLLGLALQAAVTDGQEVAVPDGKCISLARDGNGEDTVPLSSVMPELSFFEGALEATGLDQSLSQRSDNLTLFAPPDTIFNQMAAEYALESGIDISGIDLNPVSLFGSSPSLLDNLQTILTYHIVEGAYMMADLAALGGQELITLNGEPLKVSASDNLVQIMGGEVQDNSASVKRDIPLCNGYLHIAGNIVVPSSFL